MPDPVVIFGFGDIGQRLASQLQENGVGSRKIIAVNRTDQRGAGVQQKKLDLDQLDSDLRFCQAATVYYLVPPQKTGESDLRVESLLEELRQQSVAPGRVILLSTTGVYGDSAGAWVDESAPTVPQTSRGKRRLDAEQQWQQWCHQASIPLVILRVPGIYANSRIPRQRLLNGEPVVKAEQCGYTNRIHADDLAQALVAAETCDTRLAIINVSDGSPGKIADYLQAAAREIGAAALPEIDLQHARRSLSEPMLSYLSESRKIDNNKMLMQLKVVLRYPDFIKGLKYG